MAFALPTIFVRATPYVHGKRVTGHGGKYSDFLMRGQGTGNVALIEIKAPGTKLLTPYRSEQQGPSPELTGAITQVLGQRREIVRQPRIDGGEKAFLCSPERLGIGDLALE